MDIRPKDTYRVEYKGGLSEASVSVLMQYYQPVVGGDAILIYLTLVSEAHSMHGQESHARLLSLLGNIHTDTFEHARARLEEYMLMRTYVKEGDSRNSYLYVMNSPLNASDFLASGIFASRYIKAVGQKTYETSAARITAGSSLNGYTDITRAVRNVKEDEIDRDVVYTEVKPRYRFSNDDTTINFDYDHFIATTSVLVFPSELRTQENMALIGRLGTVYGISADRMRILVSRCTDIESIEFNAEKLKIMCAREEADITTAKDPYSLPPVSFLQAKQNGAAVSFTDKRLLEHLAMDMHFSAEVINIMIEYILKVSQNRLNAKFVDMVAGEWARDGIETKEQAILETKKQITKKQRAAVKVAVPEYYQNARDGKQAESHEADADTLAKIREMQAKFGGEQ